MSNKPVLPNFMIVGSAKCGTSSFARYLQEHPDIFISTPKEPRFISSQFTPFPLGGPKDAALENRYVKDYESYLKLFEGATEKAIGEASVDNLFFHEQAIPVIKKTVGTPKIIIMLRNPVKRAFSAYQHMIRDERETLTFEEGMAESKMRRQENWEFLYSYKEVGLYYQQVKAYMDNFPKVKVIFTEDMGKGPQTVLREVFEFLEVDPNVELEQFLKYNLSGVPKNRALHNAINNDKGLVRRMVSPIARAVLSKAARERISSRIQESNFDRLEMSEESKARLIEYYRTDVAQLQKLLDRDLSNWLA